MLMLHKVTGLNPGWADWQLKNYQSSSKWIPFSYQGRIRWQAIGEGMPLPPNIMPLPPLCHGKLNLKSNVMLCVFGGGGWGRQSGGLSGVGEGRCVWWWLLGAAGWRVKRGGGGSVCLVVVVGGGRVEG